MRVEEKREDFRMFGWLRSKARKAPFQGTLTAAIIPNLIADYGELIEKYPNVIIDSSWLPATKSIMVEAIKSAWLSTKDPNLRDALEVGWVSLSSFQDGVGGKPVGCDFGDMPPQELSRAVESFTRWSTPSLAEADARIQELKAFKAMHAT